MSEKCRCCGLADGHPALDDCCSQRCADVMEEREENERLQARIAGLEAALEPFAFVGRQYTPLQGDGSDFEVATSVFHYVRAAEVLKGGE